MMSPEEQDEIWDKAEAALDNDDYATALDSINGWKTAN